MLEIPRELILITHVITGLSLISNTAHTIVLGDVHMKEEEKKVIIEYGNDDLKEILSEYIKQSLAEVLNQN